MKVGDRIQYVKHGAGANGWTGRVTTVNDSGGATIDWDRNNPHYLDFCKVRGRTTTATKNDWDRQSFQVENMEVIASVDGPKPIKGALEYLNQLSALEHLE